MEFMHILVRPSMNEWIYLPAHLICLAVTIPEGGNEGSILAQRPLVQLHRARPRRGV